MSLKAILVFVVGVFLAAGARGEGKMAGEELFSGGVPNLKIEIPAEGMKILRDYHQVWQQKRPERIDVHATVREGEQVYADVAVHLKGAYSFQGIDEKPSLTLNFDKFVPGRLFHGLSKIHLNNSVQDPTSLSEQFGRELFKEAGIVCPRATPARVQINGRDLGLCVLVEGANKSFVERSFKTDKGNLYDAGWGMMDVDKELPLLFGKQPPDRSDLKALAEAAAETDPKKRLERLEKILDLDQFITFAAMETLIVHWDGYCGNCNNYRVFHDGKRDKIVFMPHGMDQLFGASNSPTMLLTPPFKGMVARSLFAMSGPRQRYLKRIEELSTTTFTAEALKARLDKLAARLRGGVGEQLAPDDEVAALKARIDQRLASVAKQLASQPGPLKFAEDGTAKLTGWHFKSDATSIAQGNRMIVGGRELLRLRGPGGNGPGGSWRTSVVLAPGHYQFSGSARTRGEVDKQGASGVLLRISGDARADGVGLAEDWKTFTYSFDMRGQENVELVCEFRGPPGGVGEFDAGSLRLMKREASER